MAKTQYNLHSPFVYRLYTEVFFSRAGGRGRSFDDVRWRLEQYYGRAFKDDRLDSPDGLFLLVNSPHRHESGWQSIVASPDWQVTIDLYSCGIAISSPRLSKQHFLLR